MTEQFQISAEEKALLEQAREILVKAYGRFADYRDHHQRKGATEKADRNGTMAIECDIGIAHLNKVIDNLRPSLQPSGDVAQAVDDMRYFMSVHGDYPKAWFKAAETLITAATRSQPHPEAHASRDGVEVTLTNALDKIIASVVRAQGILPEGTAGWGILTDIKEQAKTALRIVAERE